MDAATVLELFDPAERFTPADQARAIAALEQGKVLYFPHLAFRLDTAETRFLSAETASGQRKNVSFDPARGRLGGNKPGPDAAALAALLARYGDWARALILALLPRYGADLEQARTSFRPVEVQGRAQTPRHDDRLLHVDAFPTRPMRGRRILRVFSNVAEDGSTREWRVGEDFAAYAARFAPRVRAPLPGWNALQAALGLTRGRRSAYDDLMLGLHDQGKYDAAWQRESAQARVSFPAGSTWLCFTDRVLHAAMAGHGAMEQTFHIPAAAMARPALAPLAVLQTLTGRALV